MNSKRGTPTAPIRRRENTHGAPPGQTSRDSPATQTLSPSPFVTKQHVINGGVFASWYFLDVSKRVILLLRIPLSTLLFLWIVAFLCGLMSHTIRAMISPMCFVPGISSSSFCVPPVSVSLGQGLPKWADFPSLVNMQTAAIEQLLDESSSGSALALQIKKAEIATTDLVTLVGVSELKSRESLSNALRSFVDDARKAGRSLNKLNAKVAGAVDGITAVNDYALHSIQAAAAPSLLDRLVPWRKTDAGILLETFEDSMNYLSSILQRLVLEFEVNMQNLYSLEEQLSVLHEIVMREDVSLSAAKSELLGELWTILGGNRKKLRGYAHHLEILKGLGQYRIQALAHVISALQTLTQMSEDIENLRERVAAPELTESRIPVHVHIKSIQSGIERIKEGRVKAKEKERTAVGQIFGRRSGTLDA
ncbi:unnamed protein product [Mycena citricolor]|uniref:Uncharacterized protein n=1 Tax=Mycena citricolor TaxID=2018698 RepID=A0AAD2H4H9_9AGAR|nr:unnamed protein product [Mycena citricolor]CAK5267467.1 unnamed protein product [Mycena citricolor]